jgi:hypothetical protein
MPSVRARFRIRAERHARNVGLRGPFTPAWLVRYYVYRYGHRSAYLILGAGCFIALAMVVQVQGEQEDTSQKQERTSKTLAAVVKNIQVDRRAATGVMCESNNRTTLRLRQLIVNSARASKPFDEIYRRFGLPPYEKRLAQAEQMAATLQLVPCEELIRRIERATPPPSLVR